MTSFIIVSLIILGISVVLISYNSLAILRIKKKNKNDVKTIKKRSIHEYTLLITIVVMSISLFTNFIISFSKIIINDDVENYEDTFQSYRNNYDIHTIMKSFPETVDKENVIEFKELKKEGLLSRSYLIYLTYSYEDEEFFNEVSRLEYLSTKKIELLEQKENFDKIYIIADDGKGTKEYALINEDKLHITYVFAQKFNFDSTQIAEDFNLDNYY